MYILILKTNKRINKQLWTSHFWVYLPSCAPFPLCFWCMLVYVVLSYLYLFIIGGFELGISPKLTWGSGKLFWFVSWWECFVYRKLGKKPEGKSYFQHWPCYFALYTITWLEENIHFFLLILQTVLAACWTLLFHLSLDYWMQVKRKNIKVYNLNFLMWPE